MNWKCRFCKNEFVEFSTSKIGNHAKYCSKNPKHAEIKERQSNVAKENIVKLYGEVIDFQHKCEKCGKIFFVKAREKSKVKHKRFCSRKCSNSIGGIAKNSRLTERSYDYVCYSNYEKKCFICGFADAVDVHHIDSNRNNNSIENLVPLCPNHHVLVHRRKIDLRALGLRAVVA
jgi:hypothetical protein